MGARGERSNFAKISEATVRSIRAHPVSSVETARSFGISYRHFRQIRTGIRWKHLGRENLEPPGEPGRRRGHR